MAYNTCSLNRNHAFLMLPYHNIYHDIVWYTDSYKRMSMLIPPTNIHFQKSRTTWTSDRPNAGKFDRTHPTYPATQGIFKFFQVT